MRDQEDDKAGDWRVTETGKYEGDQKNTHRETVKHQAMMRDRRCRTQKRYGEARETVRREDGEARHKNAIKTRKAGKDRYR